MTQAAASATSRPALFNERGARMPHPVPRWRRASEALEAVHTVVWPFRSTPAKTRVEFAWLQLL